MALIFTIVKYSLFITNVCVAISSIGLISFGIISLKFDIFKDYDNESLDETLESVSIAIIAFGVVIFLIAFLGFIGAISEINIFLIAFIVLTLFIVTAEIYLVSVWEKDINFIKFEVMESIINIFNDPGDNETFPYIEATLQCCGTTGPDSYEVLPLTCCLKEVLKDQHVCLLEDAFSIGCLEMVGYTIRGIKDTLKWVLIWAITIQGLAVIGSIYLSIAIDTRRKLKPANPL